MPLVLIDLETAEGVTGRSYLFCYAAMVLSPVASLVESLGELAAGDPVAPHELDRKFQARFRLLGPQGLTGMVMAGIDMAAWDALAIAAGVPLARLLGGTPGKIAAYHSCGMGGEETAARDAEDSARLGFTTLKFKVGYADVAQDVAVIRAARKAVGDGLGVIVDYNQSLDVAAATGRARRLDEERLVWIEEPTTADDYAGHAKIAAAAATPIQLGENMWGTHDMAKAIAAGASDCIMLDVMKIGGVTGWMRAAALAEVHGLRVSTHLFPEISSQLMRVTPTAQFVEYQDWADPILQEPVQVADGRVTTRDVPGCGIAWDERAVAKYAA